MRWLNLHRMVKYLVQNEIERQNPFLTIISTSTSIFLRLFPFLNKTSLNVYLHFMDKCYLPFYKCHLIPFYKYSPKLLHNHAHHT